MTDFYCPFGPPPLILSLACDTILIISQEALFCYPHRFRLLHSPQHSWGIRLFIYRNVILGLEIRKELTPQKLSCVEEMLKTYGLDKFRNAHPSQLSGGMRQRAALIRTLALKPELLLLDEPFSALDYQTRLNVSDDIGRILRKEQKTAILVTHDISEAISMADRVIILSARPAHVARIVPIRLSLTERTPLASRSAPEFKSYFNLIWKELNQND